MYSLHIRSTSFPWPSGTPYINLREHIPGYVATKGIWSPKINNWLQCTTYKDVDLRDYTWELSTTGGVSQVWFPIDLCRIAVYPFETNPTGTFFLVFQTEPPTLSDSTHLLLPSSMESFLADLASAYLLEDALELPKSDHYISRALEAFASIDASMQDILGADYKKVQDPACAYYFGGGVQMTDVDNITPSGTIDGTNPTFTLPSVPNPTDSLTLFKNGQLLYQGVGYTLTGSTITFESAYIPQSGDSIRAWYRYV